MSCSQYQESKNNISSSRIDLTSSPRGQNKLMTTLLKPTAVQSLRTPTLSSYAGEPMVNWESYTNILPQACSCDGENQSSGEGDSSPPTYIYTSNLGQIRPVFPSLTIEKEFYQVAPPGIPFSDELLYYVLSQAENLYLAREMCWVYSIGNTETYIIKPVSDEQVLALVAASKPVPQDKPLASSLIKIIGMGRSVATLAACGGRELPIVSLSKLFWSNYQEFFDEVRNYFLRFTTVPGYFDSQILQVINQLWQAGLNPGNADNYRAINFVLTRYLGVYQNAHSILFPLSSELEPQYTLVAVEAKPSILQGDGKIYDVIFTYQPINSGQTKMWYCQVDLKTEFPYLVMPMGEYLYL